MPIAVRISCMECEGEAVLLQLPGPEDVIEAGDILAYRCQECGERWDVVVDEADLAEDEHPY
ncbi:MAG: hypothetical protein SGJ13_10530 [Actinomycetota bacterium]|nr:hypothetical protein [Actinomycetota bacterium]